MNHGVIGIVASRLVERYAKPVILFTAEDGVCVGSGRSVKGVHLFQALNSMPELFERFGGHEMAAGLTIKQEKMPEFADVFRPYLSENVPQEAFVPRAVYDMELSPKDMTLPLAEALRALAPFGMGNPSPIFGSGMCGRSTPWPWGRKTAICAFRSRAAGTCATHCPAWLIPWAAGRRKCLPRGRFALLARDQRLAGGAKRRRLWCGRRAQCCRKIRWLSWKRTKRIL